LKLHWIPDQARNDKTAIYAFFSITTQSGKRVSRFFSKIFLDFCLRGKISGVVADDRQTPNENRFDALSS